MTILQKIQSLLTAANTKTGESDPTLTDAVQTLVDGYGQGGAGRLKTAEVTLAQDYALAPATSASIMALCAAAIGTNNVLCFLSGGTSGKTNAEMAAAFYGGFSVQTPALTLSDKTKTILFSGAARIYSEANPRDALQGAYSTLSYNSMAFAGFVYTVVGWD